MATVDPSIWTIGHSTRSAEEFNRVLAHHGIELIVDVRRFPASRRFPQFTAEALERNLARAAIDYGWIPELGGRRRANAGSTNLAWHHPAFRAYAGHVTSEEFARGLTQLLVLAHGARAAVMCAELLWWRCHRRLIADVLTSVGVHVIHVRDERPGTLHRLAPPAHLVRGILTYEPEKQATAFDRSRSRNHGPASP